jgi:hypothetical protein
MQRRGFSKIVGRFGVGLGGPLPGPLAGKTASPRVQHNAQSH